MLAERLGPEPDVAGGGCRNQPAAPVGHLFTEAAGRPCQLGCGGARLVRSHRLIIYGLPRVPDDQAAPGWRHVTLNGTRYLGRGAARVSRHANSPLPCYKLIR